MDINITLNAQPRNEGGKGPARRLRREGMVPAVFYGPKQAPCSISIGSKDIKTILLSKTGGRSLLKLKIEGEGQIEEKTVMIKDHQIDSLTRTVVHVDFYEIDPTVPLEIEAALVLKGKPEGVEKGGMLQQIRRTLTVSALPEKLPDEIVLDVGHLDMGESVHVDEVQAPEGVSILFDVNYTVATVIAPKGAKTTEDELTEGEEAEEEAGAAAA